jgi:hypothetical protein
MLLTNKPPLFGWSYELNPLSREAGWTLLDDLARASLLIENVSPDFEKTAPRPTGELRVTPTF